MLQVQIDMHNVWLSHFWMNLCTYLLFFDISLTLLSYPLCRYYSSQYQLIQLLHWHFYHLKDPRPEVLVPFRHSSNPSLKQFNPLHYQVFAPAHLSQVCLTHMVCRMPSSFSLEWIHLFHAQSLLFLVLFWIYSLFSHLGKDYSSSLKGVLDSWSWLMWFRLLQTKYISTSLSSMR